MVENCARNQDMEKTLCVFPYFSRKNAGREKPANDEIHWKSLHPPNGTRWRARATKKHTQKNKPKWFSRERAKMHGSVSHMPEMHKLERFTSLRVQLQRTEMLKNNHVLCGSHETRKNWRAKVTTPSIPRRSPIQVLTGLGVA